METVNIQISPAEVITIGYTYDSELCTIVFDHDICINGWILKKEVLLCGPKISRYKYDCNRYLQFVITDKHGIAKKRDYWNNGSFGPNEYVAECNKILGIGPCLNGCAIDAIVYFIEKSSLFQSEDWADFKAYLRIQTINKILKSKKSNREKLTDIKEYINK